MISAILPEQGSQLRRGTKYFLRNEKIVLTVAAQLLFGSKTLGSNGLAGRKEVLAAK